MSSVGLSGISGISDNTLQIRYEKALKQINKLIEMNRQLKDALTEQEDQVLQLQAQVEQLQRSNQDLDEENNMMDAKYMQLEQHCRQLQQYVAELQAKYEQHQADNNQYASRIRKTEEKFSEELQNEMMKNNELSREAQMLNQMYQESLATIEQQNLKIQDLEKQNEELKLRNTKLSGELDSQKQQLSIYVKDKNINELQRKLDKANETIDKLMKQCNELRSKQIDIEVMDEKKRVEKYIGYNTIYDSRQTQAVKNLVAEYRKKYKNLEHEKKQLQKKYKHLKTQSDKSIPQQTYIRKIASLERLTEKQQAQIASLIETYDYKIHAIANQNHKLKQSCKSLQNELTKKSTDLSDKEKQLLNLKYTTDKISFENESLKRVNNQLSENTNSKLKQLASFHRDVSQTESFTVMDKKDSLDYRMSFDAGFKKQPTEGNASMMAPGSPLYQAESKDRASFNSGDSKSIPLFGNPSSDPSDFKFIQSVNIINGYNVSLGQNSSQHAKK